MASSSLYTDLYQFTMAQGYFLEGMQDRSASFSMHFRRVPFKGCYCVFCGIGSFLNLLCDFTFDKDDIEYLSTVRDGSGAKIFDKKFLDYLINFELKVDIYSPDEGELVFPYEPIVRVDGPILQCQILETMLLNFVNFETLVATKAARLVSVAKGRGIAEFGLRRAQGLGGLSVARASYIGGFASTSNVMAGKIYGIPVSGTHAHSWVMSHDTEIQAFEKYAEYFPTNSTLLIDTYDIDEGIKNAIKVGLEMKKKGMSLSGVRIDSGDLTWCSRKVRAALDEAGLNDVKIVLSNDLDEYKIQSLLDEGACVDAFGVGTRVACCMEEPTLGGVYKLNAIECENGKMKPTMKVSESPEKVTIPGVLNVERFYDENGLLAGDMVFDEQDEDRSDIIIDPVHPMRSKKLAYANSSTLIKKQVSTGQIIWDDDIEDARARTRSSLDKIDYTHKRLIYPHLYPVGIEENLSKRRDEIIRRVRHNV